MIWGSAVQITSVLRVHTSGTPAGRGCINCLTALSSKAAAWAAL